VKEAIFGSEPRDPDAEREDHRMRHSSFAEQVIAGNKDEARLSFAALEAQDQQNDIAYHEIPLETIASNFNTSLENGLTTEKALRQLEKDGPNELEQPPRISLAMLFVLQLTNLIIVLLIGAAAASMSIGAAGEEPDNPTTYIEGIAILVIVVLNAGIAAVTENSANDALEALSKLTQPTASVIRNGEEVDIASKEVVRGDIVLMKTGDIVPADCRLFESADLKVNEMLLTGEPEDVSKKTKIKKKKLGEAEKLTADNMAFSSCTVTAGNARCIVVRTGMGTRVGSIAALLTGDSKDEGCLPDTSGNQTPLQESLHKLGVYIGFLAIACCTVVFVCGLGLSTTDSENPETATWLYMILISVTLTVAAIPEGLPLCVTISLSTGCTEMVEENVLVRKLAAVETLGSASIICTDKTGTLTEGKMTMVKMFTGNQDYTVSGKGFDPTVGTITKGMNTNGASGTEDLSVRTTLLLGLLCSNTSLNQEEDEDGNLLWKPKGNSSEAPIIVAAGKLNLWEKDVYPKYPRTYEVPFSSSRKMMMTVNALPEPALENLALPAGSKHLSCVKGAPNYIMDVCTSYLSADGKVEPMTEAIKQSTIAKVDNLSEQALRVLAIAYRPFNALPYDENDEDLSPDDKFQAMRKDLILGGLVASIDPERDGVSGAVLDANKASIRVVMITGDYLKTAIAIANNINILSNGDEHKGSAVDCGVLRPDDEYLQNDDMDRLTNGVKVFARAKPEDKLEIVKSLQRQGFVCAMTGDGVNDAPALKEADIGVAMGIQGTEVAKGASDMILTDDNFCSIVKAVNKGRVIYAAIQKFVAFIMSVHIAEVLQIFLCIVAGIPIMRQPLQILFLVLCTDLPPAIALGMEPGSPDIMNDKPRPKTQPIVLPWMWQSIIVNGLILTFVIFLTYLCNLSAYTGAILQDDIANPDKVDCTVWDGQFFNPTKIQCQNDLYYGNLNGTNFFKPMDVAIEDSFVCTLVGDDPVTDGSIQCANDACATAEQGVIEGSCYYSVALTEQPGVLAEPATWKWTCDACGPEQLIRARTSAFIALVFSENFRAYTARSFDSPVWVDTFANGSMQKAIAWAQISLYAGLFVPGLNNAVLELDPEFMGIYGWIMAFFGSFATVTICEIYKWYLGGTIKKFYADLDEERAAEFEAQFGKK
jgi:potassium/sodium efflux P-type ATPase